MDNAAYHRCKPADAPIPRTMVKEQLRQKLQDFDIPFDARMKRPELMKLLQDFVNNQMRTVIEAHAEAAGHRVIYTPPYHCDLVDEDGIDSDYTVDSEMAI